MLFLSDQESCFFFKTNFIFQCRIYPIHDKYLDHSLTFSGLHFFFRTANNYSSSTLHCSNIWKVNEILSLTALADLQRHSAVLLLDRYCSLLNCTPYNIVLVAPTVELSFHWQSNLNAVAHPGLCSGFSLMFCGQEFSGGPGLCFCTGMSETEAKMVALAFWGEAFGQEVTKWLQEGRCWFTCLPVDFL